MKKFAYLVAGAVAGLAAMVGASSASAQSWSPAPANGWSLNGVLNVQQTLSLSCTVTGHAKTYTSNTGDIDAFNFSGGLCGGITPNLNWAIEPIYIGAGGGVRVHINVKALFSTCSGYIDGELVGQKIVFNRQEVKKLDGSSNSPKCYVEGYADLTPTAPNSSPLSIS
ncbi:hypothetical protein [Brevundimonas sp.]|uniref:hypothetical protein n=1 Tax=Brevundimonas sp. TaxID=1871086 RepID=UPI0025C19348|nr:hypothetical protein [Brevundimonas sp.]